MTNETDVKIAEMVARFEQAVIDNGRLCDAYHNLKLSNEELTASLSRAWQEANAKRDRYRLELLQFVSDDGFHADLAQPSKCADALNDAIDQTFRYDLDAPLPWSVADDLIQVIDDAGNHVCDVESIEVAHMIVLAVNTCGSFRA